MTESEQTTAAPAARELLRDGKLAGSCTVSASGEVTGTVTVAAASIDTKNKKRDDHLRSADFFDVGNTPAITFVAEQVTPSGAEVTVTGTLTVAGRTKPASFTARASAPD